MITWISKRGIELMQAEANRCYPLETGGVLAGYLADNGEIVIHAAFGPGPQAKHKRYRFEPHHEWQCQQLNKLYEESGGVHVYVGDWHTHPDASGSMSLLDQFTLRSIAKHPNTRLATPLMIIGSGASMDWSWMCHQYAGNRLLGLIPTSVGCELKIF